MKTKHFIIISALLAGIVPFSAEAQLTIGTRHGIALSTLSKPGNLYDNADLTASYTGGIFTTIPIVRNLALQPEVNYIRKGRCNENNNTGSGLETTCNYNYLQIPVMARYTPSTLKFPKSTIFFNAGPYAALLLKSETVLANGDELPASQTLNNGKTPDFGIILGGGVAFKVDKLNFQFDLRYDAGISKLDNQPEDFRTKALSFTAGIFF